MFADCPGLRIELHDFTKCCVARCRNVYRFFVNELSDIEINKDRPIYCNKTGRADFPDITVDMNVE